MAFRLRLPDGLLVEVDSPLELQAEGERERFEGERERELRTLLGFETNNQLAGTIAGLAKQAKRQHLRVTREQYHNESGKHYLYKGNDATPTPATVPFGELPCHDSEKTRRRSVGRSSGLSQSGTVIGIPITGLGPYETVGRFFGAGLAPPPRNRPFALAPVPTVSWYGSAWDSAPPCGISLAASVFSRPARHSWARRTVALRVSPIVVESLQGSPLVLTGPRL